MTLKWHSVDKWPMLMIPGSQCCYPGQFLRRNSTWLPHCYQAAQHVRLTRTRVNATTIYLFMGKLMPTSHCSATVSNSQHSCCHGHHLTRSSTNNDCYQQPRYSIMGTTQPGLCFPRDTWLNHVPYNVPCLTIHFITLSNCGNSVLTSLNVDLNLNSKHQTLDNHLFYTSFQWITNQIYSRAPMIHVLMVSNLQYEHEVLCCIASAKVPTQLQVFLQNSI